MITLLVITLIVIGACILAAVAPILLVIFALPIIDIVSYMIIRKLKDIHDEKVERRKEEES